MKRGWGALATLAAALWAAGTTVGAQQDAKAPYVLTSFSNASQSAMDVYASEDGARFEPLALKAYVPPQGLIRDPSVIKRPDGFYYVVYTTGWNNDEIGFARSQDLKAWTLLRNLKVPLPRITNTWAPEWFVDDDGSVHVIYSLSQNGPNGQFQPTSSRPRTPPCRAGARPGR